MGYRIGLSVSEAFRPNFDSFLRYLLKMKLMALGIVGASLLTSCAGNDDLACQRLQAELDSKKLERRQFYDGNGGFGMTTEARRGYNEFNDEIMLIGFEMESLKNCVPDY